MDKNTIIGLVLIFAIMIGYSIMNQPSDEDLARQEFMRDSIERETIKQEQARQQAAANEAANLTDSVQVTDTLLNTDSLLQVQQKEAFGAFAESSVGEEEFFTIENDLMIVTVSKKGGRPYSVELKEFTSFDSAQVVLFNGEKNIFGFDFFAQNRQISTNNLFFQNKGNKTKIDASSSEEKLVLRLEVSPEKYIEYVYTLKPNSYVMDFDVTFKNLNDLITQNTSYISLKWETDIPQLEKGRTWETDNTTIYYKFFEDEVDYLSERSDDKQEELTTRVKWIAYKQQFFSSVLIADEAFADATVSYVRDDVSEDRIMRFTSDIAFPYNGEKEEVMPLSFYFGPNKYSILKDLDEQSEKSLELQKLVPLGGNIIRVFNQYAIIPLFNFLGKYIANYGLLIFVLTVIIKIALFPLTYKSYLSSAKMRVLKPQIDELGKKFPADKSMEKQQAVMALYKKVGVNPLGGCIPILLQFPILVAMFRFFPASIELRHKSFLWADDLSTYDSILDLPFTIPFYGDHVSLFTLLMAVAIVFSTKLNGAQMGDTNAQVPGMKFMMMWMMPIMMVFWFNSYSAGLSYYYLVSNLITMGQMLLIRRFVDDEEVLRKLKEEKKKPVTKSKFTQRLEEMAKQKGYNPKR